MVNMCTCNFHQFWCHWVCLESWGTNTLVPPVVTEFKELADRSLGLHGS